jgi:hypothetical protein
MKKLAKKVDLAVIDAGYWGRDPAKIVGHK